MDDELRQKYISFAEDFANQFTAWVKDEAGILVPPRLHAIFAKIASMLASVVERIGLVLPRVRSEWNEIFGKYMFGNDYENARYIYYHGGSLVNGSLLAGKTTEAVSDVTSKRYGFRYKVVPLDAVIASHNTDFTTNTAYPAELQPRMRDALAYKTQVLKIASRLTPSLLLDDFMSLNKGAPIVGVDGVVENGNGRVMALRLARSLYPEQYQAYRNALIEKMNELGFSKADIDVVKGSDVPVILVREHAPDAEDRAIFVHENAGGMQYSVAEQAKIDAELIPPGIIQKLVIPDTDTSLEAVLKAPSNREVVDALLAAFPENERAKLIVGSGIHAGEPTQEAIQRITRAMFLKAFPAESGLRLFELFENSIMENVNNLRSAVYLLLPKISVLEAEIAKGLKEPSLSIADTLSDTVELFYQIRKSGKKVGEWLKTPSLFEEMLPSYEQLVLLQLIDEYGREVFTPVKDVISEYLRMAIEAQPIQQEALMPELVTRPKKEELLTRAIASVFSKETSSEIVNKALDYIRFAGGKLGADMQIAMLPGFSDLVKTMSVEAKQPSGVQEQTGIFDKAAAELQKAVDEENERTGTKYKEVQNEFETMIKSGKLRGTLIKKEDGYYWTPEEYRPLHEITKDAQKVIVNTQRLADLIDVPEDYNTPATLSRPKGLQLLSSSVTEKVLDAPQMTRYGMPYDIEVYDGKELIAVRRKDEPMFSVEHAFIQNGVSSKETVFWIGHHPYVPAQAWFRNIGLPAGGETELSRHLYTSQGTLPREVLGSYQQNIIKESRQFAERIAELQNNKEPLPSQNPYRYKPEPLLTAEEKEWLDTHHTIYAVGNEKTLMQNAGQYKAYAAVRVDNPDGVVQMFAPRGLREVMIAVSDALYDRFKEDVYAVDRGEETFFIVGVRGGENANLVGRQIVDMLENKMIRLYGKTYDGVQASYGIGETYDAAVQKLPKKHKPVMLFDMEVDPQNTAPPDSTRIPYQGLMLDEVNRAVLEDFITEVGNNLYRSGKRGVKIADLPAEMQDAVRSWVDKKVKPKINEARYAAVKYGEQMRDQAMYNYNRRFGFDRYLNIVFPYQFWLTRSIMEWAARAIDKPQWYAAYARLRQEQEKLAQRGIPERMRGKVRISMPFLPSWMQGGLYYDPFSYLFIPEQIFGSPLTNMMRSKSALMRQAETELREMYEGGDISRAEYEDALASRDGPAWKKAVDRAEMTLDDEYGDPMNFVSMVSSPALYFTLPYWLAQGKPEKINVLPVTKMAAAYETALKGTRFESIGKIIGLGAYPERLIRQKLGVSEFGEWGDYYIDRNLASMTAEGLIKPEDAVRAMIERKGPVYEQAVERTRQEVALSYSGVGAIETAKGGGGVMDVLSALAKSVFPVKLLSVGELRQRGLKEEYDKAWREVRDGNKKALQEFFDKHPEYEARIALYDKPEDRLRKFLVNEIYDRYYALDKANRRLVVEALGDDFVQTMLDKNTRNTGAVSVETLAEWARAMNIYVPETPQTAGYNEIPPVELYPPELSKAVDEYTKVKNEMFPNINAVQEQYYALPAGAARKAFLAQFPYLKQYWKWKDTYRKEHPELEPYFEEMKMKMSVEQAMNDMNPPLANQLLLFSLGSQLTRGGKAELLRLYKQYDGKGDGLSFEEFCKMLADSVNIVLK